MKKKIAALFALTLIAALCCTTALAYSGDIVRKDAMAFADSKMTQYVGTIPAGTAVIVRSYDHYADIYVNGKICYVDTDVLLKDDLSSDYLATLGKGSRVYQFPETDSTSTKIKTSGTVKVCAVSGDWVLIQTTGAKGLYGYVKIDSLTNIRLK